MTLLNCTKIWRKKIGARILCKWTFEYSAWPCVILQVKNWVFYFIVRWRHLYYKFVQYNVNRSVHSKTVLKSTKNHGNWSIGAYVLKI